MLLCFVLHNETRIHESGLSDLGKGEETLQ